MFLAAYGMSWGVARHVAPRGVSPASQAGGHRFDPGTPMREKHRDPALFSFSRIGRVFGVHVLCANGRQRARTITAISVRKLTDCGNAIQAED
jgi:hypothetical protein